MPRLLPHMAVYAAGLRAPLFAKGTQTTLAVVVERCGQRMERVLGPLVEHMGADLNARYPLVFGADEEAAGFGPEAADAAGVRAQNNAVGKMTGVLPKVTAWGPSGNLGPVAWGNLGPTL